MTAPWPYEDIEDTEEVTAPTWACPEDLCDCAPADAEAEDFEYSVMLTADDGTRMPGARVRVLLDGIEVNRDDPYADEQGFITFTFRELPVSVRLEWAPSDTPIEPRYPYRARHWVTLSDEGQELSDDAHVRRLTNLGFHLGLAVEDNVESFQRRYDERITRKLEDIVPRLVPYHDVSTAPAVDDSSDVDQGSSFALASTGRSRRGPTAQSAPGDAKSKGKKKKGGGTKQGSGTAAPAVLDRLVLKISARFALDAALSRRWKNSSHLTQILPCTVTMTGSGFKDVIASTGALDTAKDKDITKTLSLVDVKKAGGGVCTITIEPPSGHELTRSAENRTAPVGKNDRPSGLATEDCLFRPLAFDVQIDATGALTKVEQPHECVSDLNQASSSVANGATLMKASNEILVDWRPDYIQGASSTKKAPKTTGSGPATTPTAEMFIAIHQTSSAGATIGSNINTFTNPKSDVGIHYIVDRNGFVVKMANDDVQCTHVGGEMGAAWKTFIARGPSAPAGLTPPDTVLSINAITVGIEHVHEASTSTEQKMGLSSFTAEQMDGSIELLTSLGADGKDIITHNMVALLKSNELGHKPACPGTGYVWSALEQAGLCAPMTFNFNFSNASAEDIAAVSYSNNNGQIDAGANGTGVVETVQKALRKIGFFLPAINDQFDSATIQACRSFMIRYFGGPDRTTELANVQNAKTGFAMVNTWFLIALFEARDQ